MIKIIEEDINGNTRADAVEGSIERIGTCA